MAETSQRLALLSVSDRTGIVDLARRLQAAGIELLATGGTARCLREQGIAVKDVAALTGAPEMLGGRVKTLHPTIHAGLLARLDDPEHVAQLREANIAPISVVVVNLYPFQQTIAREGVTDAEALDQVDIGGVALLRSAAKNHAHVLVASHPDQYDLVASLVEGTSPDSPETRRRLAAAAFELTAAYDAAVSSYLAGPGNGTVDTSGSPPTLRLHWPRTTALRYGENPHQAAALYRAPGATETSIPAARQIHGKELSYNNILDADGALEAVRDLDSLGRAAAVIVKHGNPCGMAVGEAIAEAFRFARGTDPDAAFGGVVAVNRPVDAALAVELGEFFVEVVIAPAFDNPALEILRRKKSVRLLETGPFTHRAPELTYRSVIGGMLVSTRDVAMASVDGLRIVSDLRPEGRDLDGLLFAWRCVKWVKSNAIVYTDMQSTIGIGAGQMSRVDAARFGALKARRPLAGCYMASDAFLPFRDSIDAAAQHGVRGVIQPGGSVRDAEVIAAVNEHHMVMVFTGTRHFRH